MSEARKGKPNGRKGTHPSAETRKKISETLKSRGILPPWIKNRQGENHGF
jgi:hypothetical protein